MPVYLSIDFRRDGEIRVFAILDNNQSVSAVGGLEHLAAALPPVVFNVAREKMRGFVDGTTAAPSPRVTPEGWHVV